MGEKKVDTEVVLVTILQAGEDVYSGTVFNLHKILLLKKT